MDEPELLVEGGNTRPARSQDPRHASIGAHDGLNQGATDALAPMALRHDDHRNVAVRQPIGQRSDEADDLGSFNGNERNLRTTDEFTKLVGAGYAPVPAACNEQSTSRFELRRFNGTDFQAMPNVRRCPCA